MRWFAGVVAVGGLAAMAAGCGGASVVESAVPADMAAAIATTMAPYGAYTVEVEEGSAGATWYEVEYHAEAEVYFAEGGGLPKFEVVVPWDVVPAPVQAAGQAAMTVGDTLEAAELVYLQGRLLFEIEIVDAAGVKRDLYYTPEGELVPGL